MTQFPEPTRRFPVLPALLVVALLAVATLAVFVFRSLSLTGG